MTGEPYFADVAKGQLDKALIDPGMLSSYRGFRKFIRERRRAVLEQLADQIRLNDADFHRH